MFHYAPEGSVSGHALMEQDVSGHALMGWEGWLAMPQRQAGYLAHPGTAELLGTQDPSLATMELEGGAEGKESAC